MDKGEGEVLVEEVAQELAHAQVGPAAMHQQEALQEAELGEGVVRGQHRLHALLPADAHANVGSFKKEEQGKGQCVKGVMQINMNAHFSVITSALTDSAESNECKRVNPMVPNPGSGIPQGSAKIKE